MLKKLINVSIAMYGVSIVIMSETVVQTISNLFLGGVGALVAWGFVAAAQMLKKVYDHVIKQDQINEKVTVDLARIEKESKDQYTELKDQIADMRHTFESKLDNLAREIRKS